MGTLASCSRRWLLRYAETSRRRTRCRRWRRWPRTRRSTGTLIGRRFHLACTIQDMRKLLVRNGWSCQVPARRAMERDDDAVAGWADDSRRRAEPGSCSRTKPDSP
ncbi:winged helix-turn-helix domain-containing protein [Streptomyces platensis]|uniref:helix-turn-helix domain-containing protein n=1 Tax=Streptomyces platensis TaxID=58346 RepID=UPI00386B2BDB